MEEARERYAALDEETVLPEELFKRVECTHLIIAVMGEVAEASWCASPKNAPEYVETHSIPQSLVEAVARETGDSIEAAIPPTTAKHGEPL